MSTPRKDLEREVTLQRLWAERRENDPIFAWKPHVKQIPFIKSVLSREVSEAWFAASNRSGKTRTGAYCGSTLSRFGFKDPESIYTGSGDGFMEVRDRSTNGWVVGLDHGLMKEAAQCAYIHNGHEDPYAPPFIPEREVQRHEREAGGIRSTKLKNGSRITFKSCESGASKFQSAGKDWIHFDEVPPIEVFNECAIRVAAGRRLVMFGTATLLPPEGVRGGVSWLFSERIQPFMEGKFGPEEVMCYGASVYDNPHLPTVELRRLERTYDISQPIGRIRVLGHWLPGIGGTRAYPKFDRTRHVRTQPRPLHGRPWCWCWDFNASPFMTSLGWRDGHMFRVFAEIVLELGNVDDMVETFWQRHGREVSGEIWLYGDATGGRTSHNVAITGADSYDLIVSALSAKGLGDRVVKKVPPINPFVSDRLNIMTRQFRDEHGVHYIEVDPGCVEGVKDFEQVMLDGKGGIKKSVSGPSDPYRRRTHSSDGIGYWVSYECPTIMDTRGRQRGAGRGKVIRQPSYGFVT